jgi:predicted esterase
MDCVFENSQLYDKNNDTIQSHILESLKHKWSKDKTNKVINIISNPIYNNISDISLDGIIKEIILNDRYYLHTVPKVLNSEIDMILFYHGSRDIAWTQILEYTNLLSISNNYVVAFGQCSGTIQKPEIHPHYGYASFGEIFWEIRHAHSQLEEDLLYTRAIIADMKDQYKIRNLYFIGHSNGGVFGLLLALYIPNMFTGIVSHMGGIGYDPDLYLNFELLGTNDKKTPLLFYTGEKDLHREACEAAKRIFLSKGFSVVDMFIENEIGHEYLSTCEPYILNWFESLGK